MPLAVGVLFALVFQAAAAGPGSGCTPDSTGSCSVTPSFTALLVGSGTLPSDDDLKVDGNATVVGSVLTDELESYSGGVITSNSDIEASGFGTIYHEENNGSSGTFSFGLKSGMSYQNSSCASGDYLIGCTGYLTSKSSSNNYYGADITSSTRCQALASTSNVAAIATCWSPDATSETGDI